MTAQEAMPDWRDTSLGGRIRVALWLFNEIGEGNKFSKQKMRKEISGIEQIDRRMRDLRPAGWVIKTYRDMASLRPNELYLEKIGAHVWKRGQRSAGLRPVSAKLRREVFERDGHRCVRCGIAAGEPYPDQPESKARLTLGHVNPHKYGPTAQREDFVTECARCNEPAKHLTGVQFSADQVWDQITELPGKEKNRLLTWMAADRRLPTTTDDIWARYRQLPAAHRDKLQQKLALALGANNQTA